MKFRHQVLTTCLVGFLLGGVSSFARAEQPSWMIELPEVMCIKNNVYIVWLQSKFQIRVTGIFCSLTEDLV